ncbi:MAG TPA: SpoIIE family protein phosphatase, partial [Balneolales bacterium]|nr:SpoIIE family protein phosphatase [Balneolales bacterium]
MSLKNETREAFQSTKSFYREYTKGMTRQRLGRDFHADSTRLKELYKEAVGEDEESESGRKLGPHIKGMRLFNALSKRLNPTRRLIFGGSIFGFFLHYFTTGFFSMALLPLSFAGILMVLMLELLEKIDVKKEIDLAREIQLSLLPPSDIKTDRVNISSFANTAKEVGGDYVDVINTDIGTYVIIADVSGKGLTAALYMVRIQAMVHLIINQSKPKPKELLLELNNYIKSGKRDKTFVTACVAFFPKDKNHFVFTRAGHNAPILYNKTKDATLTLRTPGLALGMTASPQLDQYLKETIIEFKSD